MLATVAAVVAHHPYAGFHPFWPMFIIGPLMFLVIVGLLISLGLIQVWHLAASSLFTGILFAFMMPAQQAIISDLVADGYVSKIREGRRNRYELHLNRPLRHSLEAEQSVSELLQALGRLGFSH